MVKHLTKVCFTSFFSLVAYFLFLTSPIYAQAPWQIGTHTYEPNLPIEEGGPGPATFKALEVIFGNILSVAFALAGFATFVMLIIGGFRYLTSTGDPKATAQARGTLTWAIVGLLFLIGAWFILRLISQFTGIGALLQFEIPTN